MTFLLSLKSKTSPRQFSQACLLLSALWLIIIYPSMLYFCPGKLPREMKAGLTAVDCDFYQYYAGAVVVRYGIWDSLYPIPKPDVYDKPNHFVPEYHTFLFNPTSASTDMAFYPALNLPVASDCAPKLITYFPGVDFWRYIYPPPAALFLWPLSFVSFHSAASFVWPTLSSWSLFLVSLFASRIYRLLRQTDSYTEGLIILACILFTYRGRTHIASGNITPIISGLIAFAVYALTHRRLLAFSCAYIPLLLFKTIGLTWLPLLLLNRAYWRTLVYLAIISLLLNGLVVALAGFEVYEKFFSLTPKIAIPAGIGVVPGLLYSYGYYPKNLYRAISVVILGCLYYGYWKNSKKSSYHNPVDDSPLHLLALLAGTMALYCLINFSIWLPYCPSYLFFPFLGWIVQEGYMASGRWRYFILGGTLVSFGIFAGEWVVKGSLFYLLGKASVGVYHDFIFQPCHVFFIPVFVLLIAFRRLLFRVPNQDLIEK